VSKKKFSILPYLLCLPAILILIYILYPFGVGLWYSLTDYVFYIPQKNFIGFSNYLKNFLSIDFWISLKITLGYVIGVLCVEIPLGIGIALLLDRSHQVFRYFLPLPLMIPLVTSALMWKLMMNPDSGVLNYLLSFLGIKPIGWLAIPNTALYAIISIDIWTFTPFVALIMLASIQNIPKDQTEAARIDGANDWQVFYKISIPFILPALLIVFLFRAIDSFNQFTLIYATTQGGPGNATMTLHVRGWYDVIVASKIGMGMTNLIILWVICYTLSTYILKLWSKRLSR